MGPGFVPQAELRRGKQGAPCFFEAIAVPMRSEGKTLGRIAPNTLPSWCSAFPGSFVPYQT